MLGVLFTLVAYGRDVKHRKLIQTDPSRERLGIPQHFGMYYAMGIGLIIEGKSIWYFTWASFTLFSSFQQLTVDMFIKNFCWWQDWNMDLWYWKQPLCQLSQNHFPIYFIFLLDAWSSVFLPDWQYSNIQQYKTNKDKPSMTKKQILWNKLRHYHAKVTISTYCTQKVEMWQVGEKNESFYQSDLCQSWLPKTWNIFRYLLSLTTNWDSFSPKVWGPGFEYCYQ